MKTFFVFFILLISSCSTTPKVQQNCLIKRAAFDIGSGTTKLVVGKVDKCQGELLEILLEDQMPVGYKQDLLDHKNRFSRKIQKLGVQSLLKLKAKAVDLGVTHFSGAATSAFRKSKNGRQTISKFSKQLGFKLNVINQSSEARLGYFGVKARLGGEPRGLLVWDIGGGSMQMAYQNQAGLVIHRGNLASVSFKQEVLKMQHSKKRSPNPLGEALAQEAVGFAHKHAEKNVPENFKKTAKDYKVVGIGGVHYYSIKEQTGVEGSFSPSDIQKALIKRSKLGDKELGGKYADTDVTNLALVLGYMNALEIKEVFPLKVNMGHGLLIDPSFWKKTTK